MEISDLEAAIEAANNNDEATLVSLFNQFSAEEWADVSYDWKYENRQKVSDFIQKSVKILPASVEFERIQYLVSEYVLALVYLPGSIDLAATALVTFWNRHQNGDPKELIKQLERFSEHPDGERVAEIAATAKGIDFQK
ncbi:hypothetical protein [Corynebacterium casei]|uniref:hypothetical protein n=2 Tax=Corynebacterium casei TaxID=160386 RepID=UPI0023F3D1CE|nr:hypothetical protein [Corynebacterium casei]MDN5799566.1 hypothetical protein [Corynebacterium casei]MDN5827425.1 hypothetical protein [Corynebacterium casei]MDN5885323.1 hypothetical protein [Corynebacterium casei]MDN5921750.1 hypothetical protein [Corynebacterium casei]MDN6246161.1 hypothetical protein [Corynebacterium casei]